MTNNNPSCDTCDKELFEHNGEYYCTSCNNISRFELTPQERDFQT